MDWFKKITFYYENGYWNIYRVNKVVGKVITEEEYKIITGQDYVV